MTKTISRVALAATLVAQLGAPALAADVEVRCEKRIAPARSRVSVDVRNIAGGTYVAAIASGANTAVSAPDQTVGDEVAFDFDSNPKDIAAGANPIAKTFIVGNQVVAQILNTAGAVVAQGAGVCRVR
jgi:hypothetical protein